MLLKEICIYFVLFQRQSELLVENRKLFLATCVWRVRCSYVISVRFLPRILATETRDIVPLRIPRSPRYHSVARVKSRDVSNILSLNGIPSYTYRQRSSVQNHHPLFSC